MSTTSTTNGGSSPHIKFYTSDRCPWAGRADLALRELGVPYEKIEIDLDVPRPDWYLKVNPRGLVPSIAFSGNGIKDQIITESAVVTQFLADAFPSHLTPSSGEGGAQGALFRARVNFFVDTWFSKVNSKMYPILLAAEGEEKDKLTDEAVTAIEKDIEPLLANAGPFFDGHERLTIAEALTAPFILRFHSYANGEFIPLSYTERVQKLPNFSKWSAAVLKQPSVTAVYDEEAIHSSTRKRLAKMKAAK